MSFWSTARGVVRLGAGVVLAAGAYMAFEAQWLATRERDLPVPQLPPDLEGLRILHLSDVHAGQPGLNLWTLRKAAEWGAAQEPHLLVLTGDVLGAGRGAGRCLALLAQVRPSLGTFAVTGNHEYGLSKNPFAHRPQQFAWQEAGVRVLQDECVLVATGPRGTGSRIVLCGADYLTGSHSLRGPTPEAGAVALLLTHLPPAPDEPPRAGFAATFAGHTHGGQIRMPTPWGKRRVHGGEFAHVEGVHRWGEGSLAVSTGIGTTFLPLRLATRPEAVLYRLRGSASA